MPEDKKMPMLPKSKTEAPKMLENKSHKNPLNIWMIISAVLAVVTVVLIMMWPKAGAGNGGVKAISTDDAGTKLVEFVNKIYGPQIGLSTLKSVETKSGLYQITVTVDNNGQAVDQVVFMTQDGLMFIPQALDITQVESEYETFLQQQGTMPVGEEQPANPEDAAAL